MHDGSRWPAFQVTLIMVFFFSTVRASSEMESSVASPAPSSASTRCLDDRCNLLLFKSGLSNEDEPALRSWRNLNVSLWKGVTWKAGADGTLYVEKLELGGLGLTGKGVAPLLQEGLTNLNTLNISGNFFNAKLPEPKLRICPALLVLDLCNNSFFGKLPHIVSCDDHLNSSTPLNPATFTPINLQVLNLSQNNFSGEVPSSLFSHILSAGNGGSLTNLTSLVLDGTALRGNIPSSLGNSTELVELKLSSNGFTGPFPFGAFQQLEKLEIVEAMKNYITGSLQIPNDKGGFGQLKSLDLSNNFLTGSIPESFGNLSNLQTLELSNNNLTDVIPKSLAKLANLEILKLNQNRLNGTVPAEFSQLSNLATLNLGMNKLTGSISPHLSNCTNLKDIWLGQNSFSGAIPPELGNLTDIVVLSLYSNRFNDSIPVELGRSSALASLDLGYNKLVGSLPDGLCDLFQVQVLLLNNNQISASIPTCFGNYTHLRLWDFSLNSLSGYLPSDLSNLSTKVQGLSKVPHALRSATYIQELSSSGGPQLVFLFSESPISYFFSYNFLSGPIRTALGSIQNMQQLVLSNNLLSGPIPEALGNASSLSYLDVSYNNLNGPIPDSFTNLHFLSFLNLSFNDLAEIPQASQLLTFTAASFLGNPFLCGSPLILCSSLQSSSPLASPSSSYQSFEQIWFSFPAFGVGVAISFSLLSSFLFPHAYRSERMAKAEKIAPSRRKPYGLFKDSL